MAEKKELNQKQFNDFLKYVALPIEDDTLAGGIAKEFFIEPSKNPMIRSYKSFGSRFINGLLTDDIEEYPLSDADKKLLLEVGAFGGFDPKSGFSLNYNDPQIKEKIKDYSLDLAEKKKELTDAEYASYSAKQRKNLVNDALKTKVTQIVYDDKMPTLDFYERDKSKPFSDFLQKELNFQSSVGFNPQIPEEAGAITGFRYEEFDMPRFREVKNIPNEVQKSRGITSLPSTTLDALETFSKVESAQTKGTNFLTGPEGILYDPSSEKFLQAKPIYGEVAPLKGYQYDPRLKDILSESVSPEYGQQFKGGGTMNIQEQVRNISSQGRYGDSTLVHMNPNEVRGLAQMGAMTINPQTGLPEAFGIKDAIPIAASIVGGVFGGPVGAGLGSGLATGLIEGDLKKGLLAGLTSYGLGAIFQGAGAAAKAAEAAGKAGTEVAGQVVAETAAEEAAKAVADEATKAAADEATKNITGNVFSDLASAFQTSGDVTGQSFLGGFENVASAAAQPSVYIPLGVGAGGLSVIESQDAFTQQVADRQRRQAEEDELLRRLNPLPTLYTASGGMTQFGRGGRTKEEDEYEQDMVIKRAPARRAFAVNPNFIAGFQPETMYFDPATINAPIEKTVNPALQGTDEFDIAAKAIADSNLAASVMGRPSEEQLSDFTRGGFDMPNLAMQRTAVIDPFQAYTGIAPPALLETDPLAYPDEMPMAEGGVTGYQEGGEPQIDPLILETRQFILGEIDDETVVARFIEKYGSQAFQELRNEILRSIVPEAQTEGLIQGTGNGGMDDDLRGKLGARETIAVSQDEFIVPADVVSMLGDGSSDAGSEKLYRMMDDVRKEKTGTTKQAAMINDSVLPT